MSLHLPYDLQGPAGSFRYAAAASAGFPVTVDGVEDVLRVSNIGDGRTALRDYVWGDPANYPTGNPEDIDLAIVDARFSGLTNVGAVNRYTATTVHSLDSVMHHLVPSSGALDRLVLHCTGHGEAVDTAEVLARIQPFLTAGYDVLMVNMPMEGDNSDGTYLAQPLNDHTDLWTPEGDIVSLGYSTLRCFFDPVVKALNYLAAGFDLVAMTGHSGGGWLTHCMAAIDTRIRLSFPNAGALPWFARNVSGFGDFEQMIDGFYQLATFEDLYLMGADGPGRRQRAIFGMLDSVFPAERLELFRDELRAIGFDRYCDWDVIVDPTASSHYFTPSTTATVLRELGYV